MDFLARMLLIAWPVAFATPTLFVKIIELLYLDRKGGKVQDLKAGCNTKQADEMLLEQRQQQALQGCMHRRQGLCLNIQPGRINGSKQAQTLCAQLLSLLTGLAPHLQFPSMLSMHMRLWYIVAIYPAHCEL